MDYFRLKKKMLMSITHKIKGFVRRASGAPTVALNDCAGGDWLDLDVSGNSLQNGIPTPDAPIEIQSVGEKSVNLATAYDVCKDFDYYTKVIEDGRNCVRYLDSNTTKANPFGFKENTQYTVSFDCKLEKGQFGNDTTTPMSYTMVFHYSDGTIGTVSSNDGIALSVRGVWQRKTMTSRAGKTVLGIGTRTYQYQNYNYIDVDTFQVQEGATAAPYEPYGKYKVPVVMRGKNLVKDIREIYKEAHLYEEIIEDNRECIRFSTTNSIKYSDIQFKENTQYTFSFDSKCVKRPNMPQYPKQDYALVIFYTDDTRSIILSCDYDRFDTWTHRVLTSAANKTISSIGMYTHQYVTYNYIDINTFQIVEGTIDEPYEPYVEPITTNIFLDEPLHKLVGTVESYLGTYADYINFKNKKLCRHIRKKVFDGTEKWRYESNEHRYYPQDNSVTRKWIRGYGLSNLYPNDFYATDMRFFISGENIQLNIRDSHYTDAESFKNSLKDNNLIVYYAEAEPTEEPLDIDLPQLPAQTVIVEIGASLAPTHVEVEYYSNVKG